MTTDEYDRLMTHATGHLKEVLIMGYWTERREGEILNLTWDKISIKDRMIRLKAEDTKEEKPKSIPMAEAVYNLLKRNPQPIRGPIFLFHKQPVSNVRKALKNTCAEDKANIPYGRKVEDGFAFNDLRLTFITDIRKAGIEKRVRSSITGHAVSDMDDRYNKVDDEDKLEAIRKLEAFRESVSETLAKSLNDSSSPSLSS